MFDKLLAATSLDRLTGGVYYALRLIKHRDRGRKRLLVKGLKSEPSLAEQKLALRLIGEIERREEVPLKLLSEEKAAKYVCELADILQDRNREELQYEPEKGRQLLEALRNDGPIRGAPNRKRKRTKD